MKIALITPLGKEDYLVNTVIDGLLDLNGAALAGKSETDAYICRISSDYPTCLPIAKWRLPSKEFLDFAGRADLIILFWGKDATDYETAEKIGRWDKTVFVDGSELGKNNRFDAHLRSQVLEGTYKGQGRVDRRMLEKCALYFRREKPYNLAGKKIVPLPFGIERRYRVSYDPKKKKDIDFVCIFGQKEYPPLRRQVRESLERFCRNNGFSCATKPTKGSRFFRLLGRAPADGGRAEFYGILARAKVGVSVGGGGFDTVRFWEMLGNGCMLITEKIDIYEEGSKALDYKRIWQFKDLEEFEDRLAKVADLLRLGYDQSAMANEYARILAEHSARARVITVLDEYDRLGRGGKKLNACP